MADDFDETAETGTDEDQAQKKAHQRALSAFHVSASYFAAQREREMSDLKFIDFDEQWDPTAKTQRAGNQTINGLPPTPARPAITINQLRGPCQQVASQRRNARLALTFAPKGNGAKQETAEAYDDIARAIQTESRASIARNWAGDRAEKAGMGWYRIDTEYSVELPTDPLAWNDQEIVYRRLLNQASVYPPPFAQEPDFSDGKDWFVTQDLPWTQYKLDYPQSKLAACDPGELTAIGDKAPDFVFDGDVEGEEGKTVRIAEHWRVEEKERRYVMLEDGTAAFEDELPEGATVATGEQARSRVVRQRIVWWSKINAIEYLEPEQEWNGAYVPLIPVIGEESNVNGERRWIGIVRPGREAAVSYNVMRSAQIEAIALASKAPYIGYFETIEKYVEWWKNANTRAFPMLPVQAAYDRQGNLLPPPQRTVVEPAIQAITMSVQAAKDDIHTTTGIPPVALGQLDPHERSGKAIQALQSQAETGASGYLDNLVNISMAYEGKVLRDLIPRIMDRPGRIVPAVGVDEQRRMVMLNYPFIHDPKTKEPKKAIDGWQPGMPVPEGATLIDLAAGEFSVQPVVGKAYATQRQATAAAIEQIMGVLPPEMAAVMAPALLEELDYPGARKIAKIAKKALPPNLAAAYEEEGESTISPEAQAVIQQQQQQLQQAAQIIETDQVKQQGQLQQAQMKAQADLQQTQMSEAAELQRAALDRQAEDARAARADEIKLEIAKLQAQTELAKAQIAAASADQDRRIAILEQMIGVRADLAKVDRQGQQQRQAQLDAQSHESETQRESQAHEREMDARQAAREPAESP